MIILSYMTVIVYSITYDWNRLHVVVVLPVTYFRIQNKQKTAIVLQFVEHAEKLMANFGNNSKFKQICSNYL